MKTVLRGIMALILVIAATSAVSAITIMDDVDDITVNASEEFEVIANFTFEEEDGMFPENYTASFNWSVGTTEGIIQLNNSALSGNATGTYAYHTAGTYPVYLNITNETESEWDEVVLLNVTVHALPLDEDIMVVPKTINLKSQGIMTIFIGLTDSIRSLLGIDSDASGKDLRTAVGELDGENLTFEDAEPTKIHVNMKDGGTLMLKFKRPELNLKEDSTKLNGSIKGTNVTIDGIKVKNPGNGKANSEAQALKFALKAENGKGKGNSPDGEVEEEEFEE
ncbi:MAG: hypothetical protein RQ758_04205 [Methanomicrobiaceae archaeon]|nr:hypothetical protein [Methanomicrobiaceae archaeon]